MIGCNNEAGFLGVFWFKSEALIIRVRSEEGRSMLRPSIIRRPQQAAEIPSRSAAQAVSTLAHGFKAVERLEPQGFVANLDGGMRPIVCGPISPSTTG
jgi:hypothetical protein